MRQVGVVGEGMLGQDAGQVRGRGAQVRGALGAVVASALLVSACSSDAADPADEPDAGPRDWVVVSYDVPKGDPALMVLLDTERAVDRALQRSGAGVIDGNEVGQGRYDLYLVGADREELWDLVEPILADAPVRWTRVELRDGLHDPDPGVIRD